jgi:hypothetical protein
MWKQRLTSKVGIRKHWLRLETLDTITSFKHFITSNGNATRHVGVSLPFLPQWLRKPKTDVALIYSTMLT